MADLSIFELFAETSRLRRRFEQTQPDSARIPILIRDELRLQRMIRDAA